MRKTVLLLSFTVAALLGWIFFLLRPAKALVFPSANSRDTYFTVHNLREAQRLSTGKGAKVGILDHNFGASLRRTKGLYAGAANFVAGDDEALRSLIDHGYWMSLTLHEVAPDAEIYALNTAAGDERTTVDAMVKAIDWAIEKKLDALTYSSRPFSREAAARLDAAVDRAVNAGVVIVFIHVPNERNLLPGLMLGGSGVEREADVNVFPFDYSVVFPGATARWQATDDHAGMTPPFLSASSSGPVTAGVVALMRSMRPGLSPAACREILADTSRTVVFRTHQVPHVLDAAAAVARAKAGQRGGIAESSEVL